MTKEGSLLYFHRNALLNGDFDSLERDDEVHYVEAVQGAGLAKALASGEAHLSMGFSAPFIIRVDAGDPMRREADHLPADDVPRQENPSVHADVLKCHTAGNSDNQTLAAR